jgi:hypothetical protein
MIDNDEETKEHPIYPAAPAGEPAPSSTVDPLEPTTTINVSPPTSAGLAPNAPAYPVPPAYPQAPNQGWPGQPPGAANLPGQWQSGYGEPDYGGQPGYLAPQQRAGAPTYRTSVFVALAGMLLVIMGVALAIIGAWLLTQGPALSDLIQRLRSVDLVVFKPSREQLRSMVSAWPGTLMVLGFLQLLIGAFVLGHRGWARWIGILIGLLGLVLSIVVLTTTLALVPGPSVQLGGAITFLVAYAFVVLALIAGSGHFRARNQGR